MKLWRVLILSLFSLFCLSACDPIAIEKTSESLSRGVYAVADALSTGRIDLASTYIQQVEKIVPVPHKRIVITPVISNGISYLIIGDNLKNKSVVVVGSSDFNNLIKLKAIAQAQTLQATEYAKEAEEQARKNQEAQNALVIENQKLHAEIDKWHNSFFYKCYLAVTTLKYALPISLIGLVVACFFFPALLPAILTLIGTICGTVVRVFTYIVSALTPAASS